MSFNASYSKYYNSFYSKDKNYKNECHFIRQVFKKYSSSTITNIIDLACGTAMHAIELSKMGYNVLGVDLSDSMIKIAKKNAKYSGFQIPFKVASMQDFKAKTQVDAIICMFAAFDYLNKMIDVKKTINNIKQSLIPGGLFIMDFWNENMFANHFERFRVKDIKNGNTRLIRISESTHYSSKKIINVNIKSLILKNNKLIEEFQEDHRMRYWKIDEIKNLFEQNGFKVLKICPFLNLKVKNVQDEWTPHLIARRLK